MTKLASQGQERAGSGPPPTPAHRQSGAKPPRGHWTSRWEGRSVPSGPLALSPLPSCPNQLTVLTPPAHTTPPCPPGAKVSEKVGTAQGESSCSGDRHTDAEPSFLIVCLVMDLLGSAGTGGSKTGQGGLPGVDSQGRRAPQLSTARLA